MTKLIVDFRIVPKKTKAITFCKITENVSLREQKDNETNVEPKIGLLLGHNTGSETFMLQPISFQ